MSQLARLSPNAVFACMLLAVLSGICYALLIPLVLSSIQDAPGLQYQSPEVVRILGFDVADGGIALAFFLLCIAILLMSSLSQIILARVSVNLTRQMRRELYSRVTRCPIDTLERMGSAKLINLMTTDVMRIVAGARVAPPVLVGFVTVLGMLLYLYLVNANVFSIVLVSLVVGALTFQVPSVLAKRYFFRARNAMDKLQHSFQGLVLGAKELKLDKPKRDGFIEQELLATESAIRHNNSIGYTIATAAANYGNMLGFFVIGVVVFISVNYYQISSPELVASVMILLYISGPVSGILASVPVLIQANISYLKMRGIFAQMKDEGADGAVEAAGDWREISLEAVAYRYEGEQGGFQLGPIDLSIRKGEITFLVGGNGSGKTTFSKLLTQHYRPTSGHILFGGTKIDSNNIGAYRQCISAIYSDYYLFASLYSQPVEARAGMTESVNALLRDFGLEGAVQFSDGHFSTLKLSDGQRRRLALVVALLEDKELYLFDEWAADQDPIYREIYYTKVLPELKRAGKAVVVISHDDRYFHLADKLWRFERGVLTTAEYTAGEKPVSSADLVT